MVGLVRGGPKTLLFETDYLKELRNYFTDSLQADELDFKIALNNAGEDSSLLILTESIEEIKEDDRVRTLIIKKQPDVILAKLLNENKTGLIRRLEVASKFIFFRAIGDVERVFQEIKMDYKGVEGTFMDVLKGYSEKGIVVGLTEKPLNRLVKLEDIYQEKCLFIEGEYYELLRDLRVHGLKYLNTGIENKDWHELEIRIYDSFGAFELHFERLMMILEALELGIVLGHSWGKDHPRVLLVIDVYRVRFFTFHDPHYIKKILLGLEHLDDGTRIIDYDVYYNRDKIYWRDAENNKREERYMASKRYRDEILSKLSLLEIEELQEMEEEILKTRH